MLCTTQVPIPPQVAANIAGLRGKLEGSKIDMSEDAVSFQVGTHPSAPYNRFRVNWTLSEASTWT